MRHQHDRINHNLAMIEYVAKRLGDLTNEFIFLGGCATSLLVTDRAAPDVRVTIDVDCIVDVLSLGHYYKVEKALGQCGFKKSIDDDVMCRWHHGNIILDVMPTDEKILGFGNRWYRLAAQNSIEHIISDNLTVKSINGPYFLATKFEAFYGRGNNDYLMSHDFEDIITLIDGREELLAEIELTPKNLKQYISSELAKLVNDNNFISYLPGFLNYGPATSERVAVVFARMKALASFSS